MSRYYDSKTNEFHVTLALRDVGIIATILIAAGMYGCPHYEVYQQSLSGKAALGRAMQDRQIAVQEAQAKMESAKLLADAEVERAKGVAGANAIIAESLKGNEAYLHYLWITEVAAVGKDGKTVVYVPTEANLPILEANRSPR
jgi:regulator of protease activity HflC (stomatin/prohibitin superfamily)